MDSLSTGIAQTLNSFLFFHPRQSFSFQIKSIPHWIDNLNQITSWHK